MFCDNLSSDSCESVMIYCPINEINKLTQDSCSIHCESIGSCNMAMIYAINGLNQLSESIIYAQDQVLLYQDYNFTKTCIIEEDCIEDETLSLNKDIALFLNFASNEEEEASIDDDTCIIYMQSFQSIECNCNICIIICLTNNNYGE